jgi:dienelactone hydrolase
VLRRSVRIEVEPDVWVDAIVLTPDRQSIPDRSLPGCIALHPTTSMHIEELAGLHGKGPRAVGWHLAKRGFAVICPKCFLWQDADSFDSAVAKHRSRHPDALGMAKMLFDAQRAVDALANLPEVDPTRLAAVGHSLGAKQVLYLMAFDARIRVGVASEGGLAYDSTNWDAPWYLGQSLHDQANLNFDHAQLLALIAPRPLLVMGGEAGPGAADGTRSLALMSAAASVWKLYSEPLHLGLWNHGEGHVWDSPQLERAVEWLRSGLEGPPQTGARR